MKVALFIPCLSEHLFPQASISMVKVLHHLGVEIEYVEDQTCCGQPAFNSGYHKEVVPIAERFIELFKDKGYIIAPSGSCIGMVKVHYHDLDIREELKPALNDLGHRIFEFTEFLIDKLEIQELDAAFNHRVTFHDSCHLLRELNVREQPRKIINMIKDIDFVEMEKSDTCCGFGGTFSYKLKEMSLAMVARKCRYIEESGAEYVIGADASCLMNINGYLSKNKFKARTMHIADLLAKSMNL